MHVSNFGPLSRFVRAFPLFAETRKHPNFLFLRNSGRKTAAHFCWNCVRSIILPAAAALIAVTVPAKAEDAAKPAGIVGTWVVKAVDAPFTHHMFVFNADGTMQQANPDAGNSDNSDSDGKGIWAQKDGKVIGKFVEVTADRNTHKFISRGEISYEIDLAGDAFTGTAAARFFDADDKLLRGPLPTPLEGKRVTLP